MTIRLLSRTSDAVLIRGPHDIELYLPAQDAALMHRVLRSRPFDLGVGVALSRLVRDGDIVIDGGAHVGGFALLALALAGPLGKVVAFEPNPVLFRYLALNVRRNRASGRVITEACALADRTGQRTLYFFRDVTTHASLVGPAYTGQDRLVVPTISLDEYTRQHGLRPDVIKLDLEGGEADALRGLTFSLRDVRAIIFELNLPRLASVGALPHDLVKWTVAQGQFRAAALAPDDSEHLLPLPCLDDELARLGWTNVVLCKESQDLGAEFAL